MTDILDRLELEQTRSGMWADTCLLLEEAAQEIRKLRCPMTDPQIKPVTAWAVVDKDGNYKTDVAIFPTKPLAEKYKGIWNRQFQDAAPHRVIEVTITPKEKG